ncbi:alpha/beta hydrolase family protein [Sphingobium yanoikuyae]|uniref:alpha/beta hydrolase family protein n=1 Tax=Sphingobium yanoikuyae TaxID=13690 RepID=UPI0035E3F772
MTDKGVATWNIEYRQVGDTRGGWPGTFQDWGAALDHLRVLARTQPLDLKHVVTVGHSAGAHAALWLAARPRLPADSEVRGADPLKVSAAVAIDGPGDLRTLYGFDKDICGRPIFVNLFGGAPDAQAGRYRQANPIEWLPLAVPQFMVASVVLEPSAAQAYAAAAQSAGDKATVITLENVLIPREAAPSFRNDAAPLFRELLAP